MIKIVSGKLGAGKTLFAVSEIVDLLCEGVTVPTNINLKWDAIKDYARRARGVRLCDSQFIRVCPEQNPDWHLQVPWGVRGCPVAAYFDEIHLFFNARDWAQTDKMRRGLLKFHTQSRKAFVDVTYICQEKETVEKQFRAMAEWEYAVVSTSHLPLGVFGTLPLKAFVVVVRDIDRGHVVKRIFRRYDPRVFGLYDSFQMLDAEMAALAESQPRVERHNLERVGIVERSGAWLKHSWHQYLNPQT